MTRYFAAASFLLLITAAAHAADSKPGPAKAETTAVLPPSAPPAGIETEKAKDWKGLQAQEQWVGRLKKQIDGEMRQLGEMRGQAAEKFKLDRKKLEAGLYTYDEKSDEFVERI